MSEATALEQYMLELVNAERLKAGVQPLAFDGDLNEAAERHSRWMIDSDTFSHTGSGGSAADQRMTSAGYEFLGNWAWAENIAWVSTRAPAGLQDEVALLHANLMNSPGHRANLLNGTYREIGIGLETGPYQSWDAAFVSQNFALTSGKPFLTGVAFSDRDGDRFYDPGEGLGGLSVTAVNASGARFATTTSGSGGYDLALAAGTYTVTVSGNGHSFSQQVTIGSKNVKLDYADGAAATSRVTGTEGDNTLYGGSGSDIISGLGGNDRLYGKAGADRQSGGSGNDVLSGSSGNDRLSSGSGRDVLNGGSGNDVQAGGGGADAFRFRSAWGSDRVTDFQDGTDRLDLRTTGLSFDALTISQRDLDRDGYTDDVLIQANGSSIALINMKAALLSAADFHF